MESGGLVSTMFFADNMGGRCLDGDAAGGDNMVPRRRHKVMMPLFIT